MNVSNIDNKNVSLTCVKLTVPLRGGGHENTCADVTF